MLNVLIVITLNTGFELKAMFHPKIQKLRMNAKVNIKTTFPAEAMFLKCCKSPSASNFYDLCLFKKKKKSMLI